MFIRSIRQTNLLSFGPDSEEIELKRLSVLRLGFAERGQLLVLSSADRFRGCGPYADRWCGCNTL